MLIAEIVALGGEVTHIPLLEVVPLHEEGDLAICETAKQRILELDKYHRVIAISVNALHFGMPWIAKYWSPVPSHIVWHGIGAATLAAFAEYGIAARDGAAVIDAGIAMTSEALLASFDLQDLKGERILILRGVGGREQLATVLRERGAHVDYLECYRRIEPALDDKQNLQLQAMAFDAICVNSNETLQNLWQCLQPAAQRRARERTLIAPSMRVAAAASALGFVHIITAANAGTEATLVALMKVRP
jgi:uroporphyrinogen-III synthase